jgi:CHRD domain-containing protein
MKKRIVCAALMPVCLAASAAAQSAEPAGAAIRLRARVSGFQEVPPRLTTGRGRFTATIDPARTSVTFTLTYAELTTPVLFAHIHFAQRGVNGGVMVFLCNNTPEGPQPRACPAQGGTVTGTFTAEDVVGPGPEDPATDQGIRPGNLQDVIRAILSGATYVNVHSERWPPGEIRGQISVVRRHGKDRKGEHRQ